MRQRDLGRYWEECTEFSGTYEIKNDVKQSRYSVSFIRRSATRPNRRAFPCSTGLLIAGGKAGKVKCAYNGGTVEETEQVTQREEGDESEVDLESDE